MHQEFIAVMNVEMKIVEFRWKILIETIQLLNIFDVHNKIQCKSANKNNQNRKQFVWIRARMNLSHNQLQKLQFVNDQSVIGWQFSL